jgi:hypothetical protein
MKSLSTLLQEFDGRNKSENQLGKDFEEIAKAAIYGGHFQVNNDFIIRILEVEFYFHSENPSTSTIYDWGMYHRGKNIDYFVLGSLHPHKSGVDVTFEREGAYRASFLIRKYQVDNDIVSSPTYLREDLFGYTGCICGDGPQISWINDQIDNPKDIHLEPKARINLTAYDNEGKIRCDSNGKKSYDQRLWNFYKK